MATYSNLYGLSEIIIESTKSESLETTTLFSLNDIELILRSFVLFLSGRSRVCMESYPLSLRERAKRFGSCASI